MKRVGYFLVVLCVILIGALGTMGLAATDSATATATVNVAESTTLTLVDDSNLTFAVGAFDTSGTHIPGHVDLNAATNKKSYTITAGTGPLVTNFSTADGDLNTITLSQLEVNKSSAPAGFVALPAGSSVEVVTGGTKTGATGVDHAVDFQFTPTGDEAAGTYIVVVDFVLTAD